MKREYWIIGIIILLIVSALTYYYFQQEYGAKCEFMDADKCDRSCKTDSDCKFSVGTCVNVKEDVYLEEGILPAYEVATCSCENSLCVGTLTDEYAI